MLPQTENKQGFVWFYNINQEQAWNQVKAFPSISDNQQDNLMIQQEQQLLLIANPRDTVLIRQDINAEFLSYLRTNGIQLPTIVKIEDSHSIPRDILQSDTMFVPYIVTNELYQLSLARNFPLFGCKSELVKRVNDKFYCRQMIKSLGLQTTAGYFCNNLDELFSAFEMLLKQGFNKVVIKVPYGSSGKGLKTFEDQRKFNSYINFLKRRGHSNFSLLIEGWHQVDRNINAQPLIDDKTVRILSITEQLIDKNGMYLGTNFSSKFSESVLNNYRRDLTKIGEHLQSEGYKGIAGIDSIIDKDGILYPAVEINGRFTQVTYLLPTVKKLKESYNFIQSRFARLSSDKYHEFSDIYGELSNKLYPCPDNNFLIYTFASIKDNVSGTTKFRIFVLFYGNSQKKINEMITEFEEFQKYL